MRHLAGATALVAVLAVVGCTGASTPDGAATSPAAAAPGPVPSPDVVPSPAASPGAAATEPSAVLGPSWVADSDGDGVPDAVEVLDEIATDPLVDECLQVPGCDQDVPPGSDPLTVAEHGANTMLILDASGSMAGAAGGGGTKMRAAKRAVTRYVVGLPGYVDAGLVVYGHVGSNEDRDKQRSCAGIETFAELGELTHRTVDRTVGRFRPVGWTPIAGALDATRKGFADVDPDADNRVILVSDGIETCDGDPVAAARRLAREDVSVTVDVVGFDVDRDAARQLERVAEVTGGTYTDARSSGQLQAYFERQRQRIQALTRELDCVRRNRNVVTRCYARARNAATGELSRRMRDSERDDPDLARAIIDVRDHLDDEVGALRLRVDRVGLERMQQLEEQARRARRRYERRYRRTSVLSVLPCDPGWAPVSATWS